MSQEFEDVTLGTQITVGLNRLLARDLTALTKSSSQTNFPMSPIDGQSFVHTGRLEWYLRSGTEWLRVWGWKNYLPPFTSEYLANHFQGLSDELTDISRRGATPLSFLASPYIPFDVQNSISIFGCASANAMRTYLGIGELGVYLGTQIKNNQIEDGTLRREKFSFDFNTDIPRAMKTGDLKWTFNPVVDKTKYLICDGKTIGNSQSDANYKGETYHNLFMALGGSEADWSDGTTLTLPNYSVSDTLLVHGYSDIESQTQKTLSMSLRGDEGASNYLQFTAIEDGTVEVEIVGAGGGGSSAGAGSGAYGGTASYSGGGGGGWFKGNVTLHKNDVLTLRAGVNGKNNAINESGGGHDKHRGSAGSASLLQINGVTVVTANGGGGGYAEAWSGKKIGVGTAGYGGAGGSVSVSISGSYASGFVGGNKQGGGKAIPTYNVYGGCCGHGGQVDGSRYYAGNEEFVLPTASPSTQTYEYSNGSVYNNPQSTGVGFPSIPNTIEGGTYLKTGYNKYKVTCGYSVKKLRIWSSRREVVYERGLFYTKPSDWDGSVTPYEGYDYNTALSVASDWANRTQYQNNATLRQTYCETSAVYTCVPTAGKIGVGAGLSHTVSGCGAGYVRVKDSDGILQYAGNPIQATRRIETTSALCLIRV